MPESDANWLDWCLSGRARQELARRWPHLDVASLEDASRDFRMAMSIHGEHGYRQWEEEMSRLARTSRDFLDQLERAKWTIFSFQRVQISGKSFWFHELLTRLTRAFVRIAEGFIANANLKDRRRELAPRTKFLITLSEVLNEAGYLVSARANDDLVRVAELLFDETGYPVSDVRKTVAHALKGAEID